MRSTPIYLGTIQGFINWLDQMIEKYGNRPLKEVIQNETNNHGHSSHQACRQAMKTEKVYLADRNAHGTKVLVATSDGDYPLVHIVRHSPDGFEWGYGGSGPADLALSILTDAVGPELAERHYQAFKWTVVSGLPFEGWQIKEELIREIGRAHV